ncbi:hypothetical protein AB0O28_32380 [Microbispora sp. NPDC088329]
MRELGMGLDRPEDGDARDAAWADDYDTAVPRRFALAPQRPTEFAPTGIG